VPGREYGIDNGAAALAGLAAGAAYVAVMELDNRLTGINQDDLKLLGRPFVDDPGKAKAAGTPVHLGNAAGLGVVYAKTAADRFPGPTWLRGIFFALIENAALYPVAAFEEHHPGVRNGEIGRYWTLPAFLLSIPRHIAYGAVLGTLYQRLRSRESANR
jgi:hypothetical protein